MWKVDVQVDLRRPTLPSQAVDCVPVWPDRNGTRYEKYLWRRVRTIAPTLRAREV
jgi:hypothetical protein